VLAFDIELTLKSLHRARHLLLRVSDKPPKEELGSQTFPPGMASFQESDSFLTSGFMLSDGQFSTVVAEVIFFTPPLVRGDRPIDGERSQISS